MDLQQCFMSLIFSLKMMLGWWLVSIFEAAELFCRSAIHELSGGSSVVSLYGRPNS